MDARFRSFLLLVSLAGLSSVSTAQPSLNTSERATPQEQADPMVTAQGPWGGLIYDITYGPGPDGFGLYALTEAGIYRYKTKDARWVLEPLLPPENPLAPPLPARVDLAHLVDQTSAQEGLIGPLDVSLHVSSTAFVVSDQSGVIHQAPRRGKRRWTVDSPPRQTAFGEPRPGSAMRQSVAIGSPGRDQIFVLQSDRKPESREEKSLLWQSEAGTWTSNPWPDRSVLVSRGRSGLGASWRYIGLTPSIQEGRDSHQVTRFLRIRPTIDDRVRFQEIDWASLLRSAPTRVREGCRGATGMIEVTTPAGYDEPPILIALGPRTVCISIDGGRRFEPRGDILEPKNPTERIGDAISAVAFADRDAPSGVRLLIGTDGVFNPEGPSGRAHGGRLFMTEDAGKSWQDITPEIEGPGGFVSLVANDSLDVREVWLLTARRGLYTSQGGIGFSRMSAGIPAEPIHALATDPVVSKEVWAASPTGLYQYSGSWRRTHIISTRSLGTRPATKTHTGQLWVGTYRGAVMLRGQTGGFLTETLPADPERIGKIDLSVDLGELPRPIPLALGIRPVSLAVPTMLDNKAQDEGYAVEDRTGIFRRQDGQWTPLDLPSQGPIRIQAMVPAPLDAGRVGALIFATEVSGDKAQGTVFLHDPATGWSRKPMPGDEVAQSALTVRNTIWVATMTGRLIPITLDNATLRFGEEIEGRHPCKVLALRHDNNTACLMPPPDTGNRSDDFGLYRPITRALVLPPEQLQPGSDLAWVARWRHEAPNTLEAPFGPPLTATYTAIRDMGDHLWVSPGLGVYTRPVALDEELPPEQPDPDAGPSIASWAVPIGLALFVSLLGLGIVGWRRRSRF